jgi:uncharacterized membrane protein YgcG
MRRPVDTRGAKVFQFFILMLTLLLGSATRARADFIRLFNSDVRLLPDTTLDVTETIVVDFQSSQRHGIYRHIPVEYTRYGNPYSVYLDVKDITDGQGVPQKYEMSRMGSDESIRIGDPHFTVSGVNTYKLHYTVRRAVNFFNGKPEVYWNVTGDQWPYPMRQARAHFFFPKGVSSDQIRTACYVGPPGSTQPGRINTLRPDQIEFDAPGVLQAGEGLTFVAGLPADTVVPPSAGQQILWWLGDWWPAILLPLLAAAGLWARWMQTGRDIGAGGAIAVEWDPPKGLSPAEVGTLIDESCDMADIVSTLVDLAARGHLKIKAIESEKLLFMSRRDYVFTKTTPAKFDTLAPHEELFLAGVFANGDNKTFLSELKGKFYASLSGIRSALYSALVQKGFFAVRPDTVRSMYLIAGGALIALGIFLTISGFAHGHIAWGIGVILAGAVFLPLARIMPAKTLLGTQTLRECEGFRRFLSLVEKDRIARMAKEDPTIFGRLLPYAMVLGVADQWAHAFEGLMQQPPDWYSGPGYGPTVFNTIWFVQDLGMGMHSMGQTFSSRPPSSSSSGGGGGFSGFSGGFSGGGFGGGGGGSW